MRAETIGIIFLVLSSAAIAFGQGTVPTGIVNEGTISLMRSDEVIALGSAPPIEGTTDTFGGAFVKGDYTNYTPPPAPQFTTIGPCNVLTTTLPLAKPTPTGAVATPLDAGPFLNVNGPNGAMQIPQLKNKSYLQKVGGGFPIPGLPGGVLPPYLDPGTYTIDNGGGGADVGSFTATLNVPSPGFLWTNADSDLTVTLAAGVDIQWSGGDPNGIVVIQGAVSTPTVAGSFTCMVPNNGEFFVTSDVTSLLPATPASSPTGSLLIVANSTTGTFSAPGLDMGNLIYMASDARNVVYQ
jgi:hypothetical protein